MFYVGAKQPKKISSNIYIMYILYIYIYIYIIQDETGAELALTDITFRKIFIAKQSRQVREQLWETFGSLTQRINPYLRSTFAVRETASLGIMGAPRVPPLNPSESIVLP